MNIFKRKKPIVVDIPVIPPRPERFKKSLYWEEEKLFRVRKPELNSGKAFYPIAQWFNDTTEYFTTKIKAEAACDKLNIPIRKRNDKIIIEMKKEKAVRNKEIADWDAKYKNKAIWVEGK